MKHISLTKRALSILLSAVIICTSCMLTSTPVFAATTANKYAYSVGVNHGTFAWLTGGLEGNFTPNVDYAATCYGMISEVTSSYKNYHPTYTYMRGNNPAGQRRIASTVVFLNGHGNYNNVCFNHNNSGGDYATGVYIGTDFDSSTSGYKYAGLESTNMYTCDHISFVACKTAYGTTNLTNKAVSRGATSALGFEEEIHSRSSAGKNWLKKYNDALANGYTISGAVNYATTAYPGSDLGTYAKIRGYSYNTVTSGSSKSNEFEGLDVNIECGQIDNMQDVPFSELSQVSSIVNIAECISALDKSFNPNTYKVTVNMYAPQDGNGLISFSYFIGDNIKTERAYIAYVEGGIITTINASGVSTLALRGQIDYDADEEFLIRIVNEDMRRAKSSLPFNIGKIEKETTFYYYDYVNGVLVCEESTFYIDPTTDNAICDLTTERVLYSRPDYSSVG